MDEGDLEPEETAMRLLVDQLDTLLGETLQLAAKVAHLVAWQGKVFDREKGELLNKIGPLGLKAIRAQVYKEPSWFDGKETIVLDYSDTSLVAHWIRDEIREVSPRLYLGLVFWERDKILHFSLQFPQ